jgi:AcrR family transcriptional regulator
MTRRPKARDKVLEAARRIVETRGAGHLTFDELAAVSGVTRGGITYHFPTKEALLKGLIEADIVDWEKTSEALESECSCPKAAAYMGQVRCNLDSSDAGNRRYVSGLMSAAMVDPGLLDPIRAYQRRKFAEWDWSDENLLRYVLLLAAEGVFWQDFFDLNPLPLDVRARIVALIERLALQPNLGLAAAPPIDPEPAPPREG